MSPAPQQSEKRAFVQSEKLARDAEVDERAYWVFHSFSWTQVGAGSRQYCYQPPAGFQQSYDGYAALLLQNTNHDNWPAIDPADPQNSGPRTDVFAIQWPMGPGADPVAMPIVDPTLETEFVDCWTRVRISTTDTRPALWSSETRYAVTFNGWRLQELACGLEDSADVPFPYDMTEIDSEPLWIVFGPTAPDPPGIVSVADTWHRTGTQWSLPVNWTGDVGIPYIVTAPAGVVAVTSPSDARSFSLQWPTPTVGDHTITWNVRNAWGTSPNDSFLLEVRDGWPPILSQPPDRLGLAEGSVYFAPISNLETRDDVVTWTVAQGPPEFEIFSPGPTSCQAGFNFNAPLGDWIVGVTATNPYGSDTVTWRVEVV